MFKPQSLKSEGFELRTRTREVNIVSLYFTLMFYKADRSRYGPLLFTWQRINDI